MKKLWALLSCLVLTVTCAVSADEAPAPVESNGYYTSGKYGLVDGGTIINAEGLYICYAGDAVDEKRAARQLMNMHRGVDPMEGLGWDNFMASAPARWRRPPCPSCCFTARPTISSPAR